MTTLILCPGLLNDARLWQHQAKSLAALAEVRVVELTGDATLEAMAARVLDQAPERFAIAGLSMGGYVAMAVARAAPGRVERLALLDTTARPDTEEQTQRRKDAVALAKSGGFAKIMPTMLPMLVHPDHVRRLAPLAQDMARAVGPEAFERQQTAIMNRPDARPGLAALSCPALVLCGRQDAATPLDRHEEMAALISGAQLEVVEECGHLSALEQPEAVSAALRRWLQ